MSAKRSSPQPTRQRKGVGSVHELHRLRGDKEQTSPSIAETVGILPDTCMWIDFFRNGSSETATTMDKLLETDSLHMCGPVLYELLQGIRSEKEKAVVLENIQGIDYVEMTQETWSAASELSRKLRASGKTIPFSDVLIAALCIEHGLAIYTEDAHFTYCADLSRHR